MEGKVSDDLKTEMRKHDTYKQETIAQTYDALADNYQAVYEAAGYHDPEKCADLVAEFYKGKEAETKIIDFGCGTGWVGDYLHKHGFKHIKGLDISEGLLAKAKEKNIYEDLQVQWLGTPDKFPKEHHGQYDAVTAAGILAEGHLGNDVFDEILLALKVGGIAVFTTRVEYLTKYSYGVKITELDDTKRWKLVKSVDFPRYDKLEEGVGRFQKTTVRGFCYQKL